MLLEEMRLHPLPNPAPDGHLGSVFAVSTLKESYNSP